MNRRAFLVSAIGAALAPAALVQLAPSSAPVPLAPALPLPVFDPSLVKFNEAVVSPVNDPGLMRVFMDSLCPTLEVHVEWAPEMWPSNLAASVAREFGGGR